MHFHSIVRFATDRRLLTFQYSGVVLTVICEINRVLSVA
jgi:hypothetical protein